MTAALRSQSMQVPGPRTNGEVRVEGLVELLMEEVGRKQRHKLLQAIDA